MFYVRKTNQVHRRKVTDDYIVAVNKNVRKKFKLQKFAVVKYLFIHKNTNGAVEFKELKVLARVISDTSLVDNEVALDQTLRNAIAIPFNYEKSKTQVSLAKATFTFIKKVTTVFNSGRHILLRVEKPDVVDIEKDYCRLDEDVIKILQTDIGKRLVLDGIYNKYSISFEKLDEVSDLIKNDLRIVQDIQEEIKKLIEVRKVDNLMKINAENRNVSEILNYYCNDEYFIKSTLIEAHSTNSSFIEKVAQFRINNESDSFESRYPDVLKTLNIKNDLMSIHLDSFYRTTLNLNMLDSVRVRRYWFDIFKTEIIDYGLLFVISVFTTVLAVDSDTFSILPFALGLSMFLTVMIIIYRNR